ncbi:hypothetical protein P691DRAFT_791251 [Macrolepiota fuliginosa MF-IS2]|uniref:Uncharacterized protein n=1 Tax=Macrolepiota fuliginosa MF-IS2 TaxID=1400762 RepID=A0A9P5X0S2_9AGAR|nr:hypothetical protein P691DRAFT_791251 [Macrolepiota fuliginosa MF-IS2]
MYCSRHPVPFADHAKIVGTGRIVFMVDISITAAYIIYMNKEREQSGGNHRCFQTEDNVAFWGSVFWVWMLIMELCSSGVAQSRGSGAGVGESTGRKVFRGFVQDLTARG